MPTGVTNGSVSSFTYDPVANTLTVSGLALDDTPFVAIYNRRPDMDVPGYQAYTVQDSSLDRHVTAFVQERDGTRAMIAVSGPQFNAVFAGSSYNRDGAYTPPTVTTTSGLVSYAGSYAGLLNATSGDGSDLHPVAPGTPPDILPTQAAEVTGNIFINADFADNVINGRIYNRVVADTAIRVENLDLTPTAIAVDGTFTGGVGQGQSSVGNYEGIFGGTDASAVAGTIFVTDHIASIANGEETGLFVLAQCGTANADPVCDQPVP